MADSDESTEGGKPKVDPADLKARLGLQRRTKRPEPPKVNDPAAMPATASAEEIERARSLAEQADAAAGTPLEAFDPLGQEHTPLPQPLPAEDLAAFDVPTKGKLSVGPVLVAMLLVVLVGVLLGTILGKAMSQREQRATYAELAKTKLKYFQNAKTASGEPTLAAITAMKEALDEAVESINAVSAEGDILQMEKPLQDLIPKMAQFQKESAYISPEGVMEDLMVIYSDDPLLDALRFATRTRQLYDTITAAVEEATTLMRIARPSGSTTRTILVERGEQDVAEVGKIPVASGRWIKDTGKPAQITLKDPNNSANDRLEWQMMVLPSDAKSTDEAVQVPTSDVMSLDISSIYNEQTQAIRKITVSRLAELVRNADTVAGTIKWPEVERELQEWAAKAD
ncbi:MAG: hypothetical protein H6744_15945 [Deltaproteobacteria bacterium]|nr:hypothetical protein [Deltaproteobacteria bacterium]MCB9788174.1 hypothetical protein [Deltaproteobacteria bacterium]